MKSSVKALLIGSVAVLAFLLAMPATSDAHPWAARHWYPHGYYAQPYGAYYGGPTYPGYDSAYYSGYYYGPGAAVYRYRPYYRGYYYGYGPRVGVRVGPVGVWW